MEKGYLAVILHAHLPFVRHPEYEDFLEEDWFYEAVLETYIPLIKVLEKLIDDNIEFKLTISLSPTLLAMFADSLLQERTVKHIERLIELSEKEIKRTAKEPQFNKLAIMYKNQFLEAKHLFLDKYNKNLITAFKKLQDTGKVEIITCSATHAYLPLMEMYPSAVRAQIKTAVDYYRENFGKSPSGMWLAECAYQPGHDFILKEFGIKYFFVDTHGITLSKPRPKYGVYAPIFSPSGVAAFGRDIESSKQVWSSQEGYPGDYEYRDFYRDVGFDLDYDYVKPYIVPDGTRIYTGIKYYKITGKTNNKETYSRESALEKAAQHAGNFMFNREKQVEHLSAIMDRKPVIVATYDAELFGHWWYEGINWLDYLFRKICYDQKNIKLITPKEYLEIYPKNQVAALSMSSWGYKGYSEVWLEKSNDWIYRHLHKAIERMAELAGNYKNAKGVQERALKQAAREVLLASASDWPFIMKTGSHIEYAVKRFKTHISRFTELYDCIKNNSVNEKRLTEIENSDNIFPNVDFRAFETH